MTVMVMYLDKMWLRIHVQTAPLSDKNQHFTIWINVPQFEIPQFFMMSSELGYLFLSLCQGQFETMNDIPSCDNLQGYIRRCGWFSVRCLGPWFNHLPLYVEPLQAKFIWVGHEVVHHGWYFLITCMLQHIEAETKWTPFRRRHFEVHFL